MTRLNKAAAIGTGALFAYYEIYRWIPLGKWNWQFGFPVSNDQFYPDIVIGLLLLWFTWSLVKGRRTGIWAAAALLTLWVVVHCFDWWIPYAKNNPHNAARYSFYQPRSQLLPAIGNHYPPDGGHAVLDFILFPTCVVVVLAAACGKRGSESERL